MNGSSAAPRGDRFLLKGGVLVTLDPALGQMRGDLLVDRGIIAEIAPAIDAGDAEIVDARDAIVIPGFVDCHRHLWQTSVRHIGAGMSFAQIMGLLFSEIGPRFRPEDVYAATLFGRLAALDAGVTTVLDWAHIQNTPEHSDASIRALKDAGGRSIFGHGQPAIDARQWMSESVLPHPADIGRVRSDILPSDDGLLTMAMAARGPEFSTMETVEHDIRLARTLGLRVTIHIGLGALGPKYRGVERMHARGLLGPDITLCHCCTCSDPELRMIADTGTTVTVSTQMAALSEGFGIPATTRLLAHGVRPSLSVDSEISAAGDVFSEMRFALGIDRALRNNGLIDVPAASAMSPLDALRFATIEGARAVGMEAKIGSLTVGKSADMVMLRSGALALAPVTDPVAAVVMGGQAGVVESVLVAGVPAKWGGRLLHASVDRARALVERSHDDLLGARA
jgi:cytosine/adenosine deaminase-related metal-dependent hydrolase